ncbi:hypothetical protein EYF80_031432 [Liparis tanakae]|uniref:Uncharacterized protein n=1 Tax=Liparis tanakae TaxID=230148 RepID=A0A4Z2GY48_9TELE|nr:hypothetical protein EYF80_031432 [Liparis tanakae]
MEPASMLPNTASFSLLTAACVRGSPTRAYEPGCSRSSSPAFGTTRRPPGWPNTPLVLGCSLPALKGPLRSRLRSRGKVSAGPFEWNSARSATPSETIKEL